MFVRKCSHQLIELRFIYRPIKLSFGPLKCVCVCVFFFFPNKKISPNNWSNPYKNKQASYVSVTRKLRSLLEVHLWSSILITKRPFYFLHIFMEFEGNFLLNYFHWSNTYILYTLNNNFMHLIYMTPLSSCADFTIVWDSHALRESMHAYISYH